MKTLAKDPELRSKYITLGLFVLLAFAPMVTSSFTIFLLTRILFTGLISMCYSLLTGYAGMASFAHISFYGITAYTVASGTIYFGLSYWQALGLAFLLTLGVALVFGLIAVRTNGRYFLMMTVAFCQLVYMCSGQWVKITNGYNGISGVPAPVIFGIQIRGRQTVFYFTLIVVALCYLALKHLVSSPFGIVIQGVRDNQTKMSALGFNVKLQRYVIIVVSAMFAAVAGVLSIIFYNMIAPESIAMSAGIIIIFCALIGCVGKLEGALLGSVVYVLLEDVSSQYTERYTMVIGLFFILVVLFMPNGILGVDYKKLWKKLRRAKPAPGKGADG